MANVTKLPKEPLRIGLLGCGAINSKVAEIMISENKDEEAETSPVTELVAILVQTQRSEEELQALLPSACHEATTTTSDSTPDSAKPVVSITTNPDDFFSTSSKWNLCVEAAGQPAVRLYGKRCLAMGRDLMITSIGSLTDDDLYKELRQTAEANGSRLILCTGSLPAVDWMGSAALATCAEVKVTQIKPPHAWLGTPAEANHPDLLTITKPRTVFQGSAREAARLYPKNANVAAMLALTTSGLDETRANLIADPNATSNRLELSFVGEAGKINVQVEAAPSKDNPRTSAIVALSVVKAIRKLCSPVIVGL